MIDAHTIALSWKKEKTDEFSTSWTARSDSGNLLFLIMDWRDGSVFLIHGDPKHRAKNAPKFSTVEEAKIAAQALPVGAQ